MGGTTPAYAIRFPYIDETISDVSTKNAADDIAAVLSTELDVDRDTSLKRASGVSFRSGNFSVAANTETAVSFNQETWDTDAAINIAGQPTRLTVPTGMGGLWWVAAVCGSVLGTAWSSGQIAITKNGTDVVRRKYWSASGQMVSRMQVTAQMVLVPTDFVTVTILFQGTPNPSDVDEVRMSGQRLTT